MIYLSYYLWVLISTEKYLLNCTYSHMSKDLFPVILKIFSFLDQPGDFFLKSDCNLVFKDELGLVH